VSATIAAAEQGGAGEVYNVAGGAQATVLEVIDLLGELLGSPLTVRHLPAIAGDARHTGADTTKASSELGFAPVTGLEQGLASQVADQTQPPERAAQAP
jgi:UDP-glucuronate 4-epimerase